MKIIFENDINTLNDKLIKVNTGSNWFQGNFNYTIANNNLFKYLKFTLSKYFKFWLWKITNIPYDTANSFNDLNLTFYFITMPLHKN